MINKVSFTPKALKQLEKLPLDIYKRVRVWAESVKIRGVAEVRLVRGYRDHPLKGNRQGQRSVSINKHWRLIYTESLEIIEVEEVNKHDYRTN
jgi:proteic killer suppression protein